MLKFVKINLYLLVIILIYLTGCGSGEYDIEKYQVNYTEKTVKADTLRTITLNNDIKEEKKEVVREVYTFTVQIGAFANPVNFNSFYENARTVIGSEVYYEESSNLYKVRVGNFPSRSDAVKFLESLKSKGYLDAFIVSKRK